MADEICKAHSGLDERIQANHDNVKDIWKELKDQRKLILSFFWTILGAILLNGVVQAVISFTAGGTP